MLTTVELFSIDIRMWVSDFVVGVTEPNGPHSEANLSLSSIKRVIHSIAISSEGARVLRKCWELKTISASN